MTEKRIIGKAPLRNDGMRTTKVEIKCNPTKLNNTVVASKVVTLPCAVPLLGVFMTKR